MKKLILSCIIILALVSFTITGLADMEVFDESTVIQATVIAEEPSSFCVLIPSTIYVGQDVTLTAELINIRETEQVNVVINNLNDNNCIQLYSEDGASIYASFYGIGHNAGTFTTNDELRSSHSFHFQSEGGHAGTYSGTAEFTVNISLKQS